MKKWYVRLLAAVIPMLGASMVACNDDDDLPNVDFSVSVDKGTVADDTIYVVQGDTIKIGAINVINNEEGKGAGLTNVNYYWDGFFYAPAPFAPFGMNFPTTESTPVGKHSIDVSCTVLAVDKTIASAALTYPVVVVADEADLPSAPEDPTIIQTTSLKK